MKPIIFIPGIQATSLVNTNTFDFNYIWNAYNTLGSSISTSVLGAYIEETLQINPLYDEGTEVIVERNHLAKLPYENTIVKLKNKLKKTEEYADTPIYLFGYDWRMSNMESGKKLKIFVDYLKEKLKPHNVESFRFITHSMGGLVFSCYLNQLNGDYSDVDKVIINTPPFLGSPYSLVHMIKGNGGFRSILNWAIGRNEDMRKVIRTYPGVFELLPVYNDALTYTDNNEELNLVEKRYWQSNIYDDINQLFDARLELLREFRSDNGMLNLSELPEAVRDKMVIIVGREESGEEETFTYVKVERSKNGNQNFVDLNSLKQGKKSGDGTVPFISSTIYKESIKTLAVTKENFFDESSNSLDFHGLFLRDSRVQNIIERYLTCEDANPEIEGLAHWYDTPNGSVERI